MALSGSKAIFKKKTPDPTAASLSMNQNKESALVVTIKDIAKYTGISRGTVDRVLNHRGKVSEEKRIVIENAVRELGYEPNVAAQGLAVTKKKLKIAFTAPDEEIAPVFRAVREGAEDFAEKLKPYGVNVIFIPLGGLPEIDDLKISEYLRNEDIDGWCCGGYSVSTVRRLTTAAGQDVPIVGYNIKDKPETCIGYVGCDYFKAGRVACGVLAMMIGRKGRVAVINYGPPEIISFSERYAGFLQEMSRSYPQMSVSQEIFYGEMGDLSYNREKLKGSVQQMIQTDRPDAVYLVNPGDYSSCRVIARAFGERRIPIVTNDLISESRSLLDNGLIDAMIDQEPRKQGSKSLEILFDYLAYGKKPENFWYETKLGVVIRQNAEDYMRT